MNKIIEELDNEYRNESDGRFLMAAVETPTGQPTEMRTASPTSLLQWLSLIPEVVTLAGMPAFGYRDDVGTNSKFQNPSGVVCDSNGLLYIADYANHAIRRLDPFGKIQIPFGVVIESMMIMLLLLSLLFMQGRLPR